MPCLLFTLSLVSTRLEVKCQDFEMTCDSTALEWMNGGKGHWSSIVHCPYVEYPSADSIPGEVRAANDRYLNDRLGKDFFIERVGFRGAAVVRPEQFDELKLVHPWIDQGLCNGRIAHAFQYYFPIQDSMIFLFTTMFDAGGNLVGPHQIPDTRSSECYQSWIDACTAKSIADQDGRYVGLSTGISFEYHEPANCFVWRVRKPVIRNGREITTPFVIVNAQTGSILNYSTEHGIIVCEMKSW